MNVTIVGGGNIGTQFAVLCGASGHSVTVYTSRPERFRKELTTVDAQRNVLLSTVIAGATADPAEACNNAELILVTVPADHMASYAARLLPHIRPGTKIGLIPGTGGSECAFRSCLDKDCVIFGLQRVPSVARLVEYGSSVCTTGYRPELFCAALPAKAAEECCRLMTQITGIPCTPLPHYLNVTLTPSNPILHTTRLRTLFADYAPGVVYDRIPLFYEEWTDESSRLLFACDSEVQALCRCLSMFDLSGVRSLREHYESDTPEALTHKITHIASFRGLKSPEKPVEGGYIPDFSSRYFTADFPYGLSVLVQLAQMASLDVPNMQDTLNWYRAVTGRQKEFSFQELGITRLSQLVEFYNR